MMTFLESDQAKVVNGQFGVKKSEGISRLIDDLRPANLVFKPPPPPGLPLPSDLGNVVVPKNCRICFGKRDCRNFYHKFRIPEHLWPYFCWKPVWSTEAGLAGPERLVYPARTTMPMGWTPAVTLGQTAHENIVYNGALLKKEQALVERNPAAFVLESKKTAHMIYVDDLINIGLEQDVGIVKSELDGADSAYDQAGTPSKKDKAIDPQIDTIEPMTALGNDLGGDGIVRPAVDRLTTLVRDTNQMLKIGKASPENLQKLTGRWISCLLLTRPILSVLARSFAFGQQQGRKIRVLPEKVKQELSVLIKLAPMLRVDLTMPLADSILASDASSTGGGVSYRRMEGELSGLLDHREIRGWYTRLGMTGGPSRELPEKYTCALKTSKWKIGVSVRWRLPDHINCYEMNASVFGLRWMARSPRRFFGTRFPFLLDSMVALGAIAKGRSSSQRINYYVRKIAAYTLALNLRPYWTWVPTAVNPADEPSRR
eukprot:Lithocolla_globosa_v1_NODE_182_length_5436_cov_23.147742.p1 type:complete len:485 gc:universal NODE_182_length_5436_cov_23.147742:1934-3388(+)